MRSSYRLPDGVAMGRRPSIWRGSPDPSIRSRPPLSARLESALRGS